jgi:hypothetical protein|nr:MAG TPA: hypothetical protein [Caudoviricetes sp.]
MNKNNVKIIKGKGKGDCLEINGVKLLYLKKVEIKNDYTSQGTNESVIIEIGNIGNIEILDMSNETIINK